MSVHLLRPEGWADNLLIAYTTRAGGCSSGPYRSMNLGAHVGDDAVAVRANRAQLLDALPDGVAIAWLNQVHGNAVVQIDAIPSTPPQADACWTSQSAIALAIMTADCLPVLLADRQGTVVAAVHAGWRGLASGAIEAAIDALPVEPGQLQAWLGPAIGADAFEVGGEVRACFLEQSDDPATRACFRDSSARSGHYLADLAALAGLRLRRSGVSDVRGLDACTFGDPGRFFSYRRDGATGRMACVILRLPTPPDLEIPDLTPISLGD